jgi:hypothetical protein
MDAKSYYKVMLTALGYKQTVGTTVVGDFTWENLTTFAAGLNLKAVAGVTNFTVSDLATATIETLKTNAKDAKVTLAASLVEAKVITLEKAVAAGVMAAEVVFGVDTVTVKTAKSFEVKFTKAVADTAAMKFAVTRGTVSASITTTWNEAKTVATLTAAAKLPEAKYLVVVTNGTTEMAKKELEIGKEVIKTIEYGSTEVLRATDATGILRFKVLNQYGEDVTNLALGRGLDFIVSTNKPESVDFKAGVMTVQHGVDGDTTTYLNQLKDLKTVVITARDITTGFVQTNTFTVSTSVGVVADVKLIGIVDEKGNAVDFKFDHNKTYYLSYEATDILGNKIDNFKALDASLYGQKILDVRSSNDSLVKVVAEKSPSDSTKMAYRLQLIATSMDYDTPMTFLAIAPFAAKSSNLTTTLYRKAKVETFKMQNPAETASMNRAVEIPFEAFDQAGNAVTLYDDIYDKVTFSASIGVTINFVKQADGTAKLFGTFPAEQTYYVTSTVKNSLTGSFSQIGIDVKKVAASSTIDPLRHARAYYNGGTWGSVRVSSFTVRDQFDRAMNLRSDAYGNEYAIRVTSSDSRILDLATSNTSRALASDYSVSVQITGDDTLTFKGAAQAGTASVTYELIDLTPAVGQNPLIDTASAIAYNVSLRDIKSVDYNAEAKTVYMAGGDTVATNLITSDELYNDCTLYGKTDSGMEVRLPSTAVTFTITNGKFVVKTNGDVANTVAYTNNATTDATVVTAYFNGFNGILTDSVTINASNAAPVVSAIDSGYDYAAQRNRDITIVNDVVTTSAAYFNASIDGTSIYTYNVDGTAVTTAGPVYVEVSSQYGAWVANDVRVTPAAGNATGSSLTVDVATGVMTGNAVSGDEFTVTVLAKNGVSKVIRFRIQ